MAKILKQSEQQIQKSILDYLTLTGWYAYKQDSVGIYDPVKNTYRKSNTAGKSDLIAINKGLVLFIEVKSLSGKQTPAQEVYEQKIKSHGGNYIVARSIEDVQNYLAHRDYEIIKPLLCKSLMV